MSQSASNKQSGFRKVILLLIAFSAAVILVTPVSADPTFVTIAVRGSQAYYLGEEVVLSGVNSNSDSTYLYITGPNLPENGGNLSAPHQASVSGDPGSFTVVKTNPDKTWTYRWYTSGLRLDAGSYTLYAVSGPEAKDQLAEAPYGTTGIIIKKPFLTADISSPDVVPGQPFTVTGTAEGNPPEVRIWIIGNNYMFTTKTPVHPDASFTFNGSATLSGKLPDGRNYLIVQHPMADNQFDFAVSGDYVRDLKLNNGTNLFGITGSGSLQGSDAADELTAAISDQEAHDTTLTNDTYTLIPFQVNNTGSSSAGTGVTISADGDHSYYLGEKVILRGQSPDADTVYLFLTGPNLQATGVQLTSPEKAVVSGKPDSFTVVKTKPDKTWEYSFYTANIPFDAGTYSIYAVSQPKAKDPSGSGAANVGIIIKKPFLTANISSPDVVPGQSFTVTGTAEGNPPEVRIWIIGDNYVYSTTTPVNIDGLFTFNADTALSGKLPAGQNYLIVEHPMADNQFDFAVSGDYVRNLKQNNGTNLFRITGPGSLQGSDAVKALISPISDQEAHDHTYANDTYTIVPFQVTASASAGTGVTIAAQGDQSYYLGEKVVLSGHNYDSDTTYLFITGPGTFKDGPGIPTGGGKLTSPLQNVVSGNPDSFTTVKTKPDKSWEYVYYTTNLPVDAGTYTIFAASQPKTSDQLGPTAANVGIILKKPFITAEITPSSISQGQPFTVSGFAEGNPETVQIWILGKNSSSKSKVSVDSNASFRYVVPREVTSQLAGGQYFVVVQHPMQNTTFDIDASGDYVRSLQPDNGANLFRISGPGSLQGSDAADALIAAFSDPANGDDTYTEIPVQVTDAGIGTILLNLVLLKP
ncbi:MAG: hypothetical protein ABFC24_13105 [Methanoregulaceae archaeon]